jgi:hypothetical protein
VKERTADLVQANQALQENEKRFRAMVDTSPLAIYLSTGEEQNAIYVNPTFSSLFGYTLEDDVILTSSDNQGWIYFTVDGISYKANCYSNAPEPIETVGFTKFSVSLNDLIFDDTTIDNINKTINIQLPMPYTHGQSTSANIFTDFSTSSDCVVTQKGETITGGTFTWILSEIDMSYYLMDVELTKNDVSYGYTIQLLSKFNVPSYYVSGATIVSGGSSYVVSDKVKLDSNFYEISPIFTVTEVTGGKGSLVSSISTSNIGNMISIPNNPVDTIIDDISAFGLTLDITWNNEFMFTTDSLLPSGILNETYKSAKISVVGGYAPYSKLSITSGTIPTGLTFNNGIFSGTPTEVGVFTFMIEVSDYRSNTIEKEYSITISAT